MPGKRLHRDQWCAHRIEQRRIRMPQPVPAHAHQPQLLNRQLELLVDEIVPRVRVAKTKARDSHPPFASGENLDGLRPQGNCLATGTLLYR